MWCRAGPGPRTWSSPRRATWCTPAGSGTRTRGRQCGCSSTGGEGIWIVTVSIVSLFLLFRDPDHAVEAELRLECEAAGSVLVDVYHGLVLDR